MIVLMAGLPGTGKSSIARALARKLRASVLDKDHIRPALFTPNGVTYARAQDDFCANVMLDTAAFILTNNGAATVILDGRTCSRSYQVQQVREFAIRLHQPLTVIECTCDDPTARQRLNADLASGHHPARNRTFALHQRIKASAEPIAEPKLIVNTGETDLADCITACLAYLTTAGSPTVAPLSPRLRLTRP